MAYLTLKIHSEVLEKEIAVHVILPQPKRGEAARKYPTLYLLHGLGDNETVWARRTSIERYAEEYGICVIMPDGARSFYTDMRYGGKFYTYVAKELPELMEKILPLSPAKEDRYIAGNSMGGYGALKIGMKECDRFAAVAGLSSVADIVGLTPTFRSTYLPVFGEELLIPESEDLFAISEACAKDPNKPRILMIVGTSDFMYQENRKLKAHMENLDLDYTYRESEGGHCWSYWDQEIQSVLAWMFRREK